MTPSSLGAEPEEPVPPRTIEEAAGHDTLRDGDDALEEGGEDRPPEKPMWPAAGFVDTKINS